MSEQKINAKVIEVKQAIKNIQLQLNDLAKLWLSNVDIDFRQVRDKLNDIEKAKQNMSSTLYCLECLSTYKNRKFRYADLEVEE